MQAKIGLILLCVMLSMTMLSHNQRANATEPTYLRIVNPLTGGQWFSYTSPSKNVGDTFIINITVINVTDLICWQFALQWDPSLLTCVNATIPSDNVFSPQSLITMAPDISIPGMVVFGACIPPGGTPFTGSGRLAQVELMIIQGLGQSPLSFADIPDGTFLLDSTLVSIPFTAVNGYYEYGAEQTYLNVVNPLAGDQWFNFTQLEKSVGDTFIVNVTITNVKEMVCWQFALQWNSSLLECVNATIPSDNVFAYWNSVDEPMIVGGPDLSHSGLVLYGAEIAWPGNVGFNGSGVLAQVEFKILQKGGQSELSFEGIITDTFLLHGNLSDIPFVPVNAHYSFNDSGLLADVNNDGTVDMKDVMTVVLAFNSFPTQPRWNSLADIDNNGRIDMRDIVMVLRDFKKHV